MPVGRALGSGALPPSMGWRVGIPPKKGEITGVLKETRHPLTVVIIVVIEITFTQVYTLVDTDSGGS